jgi:DNA processing protein
MKINNIRPEKHKYLQIISTIANTPKSLYYSGTLPESRIPTVALIGSRKPTPYGREVAHRLGFELAQKGVIVLSGLALGIDGIAHRGALEAGGVTIAVLGNGLPNIYPSRHHTLGKQIVESGGAILSEYDPGTPAMAHQFLERNRIVSGLSDAIVIVEAAQRSGTLNTATHALSQGKEVFVVPGNITSPLSAGCNALIKQGAHPLTCTEDILEVIAPRLIEARQIQLTVGDNEHENKIISLLQEGLRDGDILQAKSTLEASVFSQTLTMLEIKGIIRALGANQWFLR